MDCKLCREHMKEYLMEKMDSASMKAYRHHLGVCPDCRREVDQTDKLNQLLNSLSTPKVSHDFDQKLQACIRKKTSPWWKRLFKMN